MANNKHLTLQQKPFWPSGISNWCFLRYSQPVHSTATTCALLVQHKDEYFNFAYI